MNKSKAIKITVISTATVVVLAIIATILAFCLMPVGGKQNRSDISVCDNFTNNCSLTLDMPMKKGYYTPHRSAFNSELTIAEICDNRAKKVEDKYSYEYKIMGNNAIIYKKLDSKIIARAQLLTNTDTEIDQKYIFTSGGGEAAFTGSKVYFIAPYCLSIDTKIKDNSLALQKGVTMNDIKAFYEFDGLYDIVASENTLAIKNKKDAKEALTITLDTAKNSLIFSEYKAV